MAGYSFLFSKILSYKKLKNSFKKFDCPYDLLSSLLLVVYNFTKIQLTYKTRKNLSAKNKKRNPIRIMHAHTFPRPRGEEKKKKLF